MEERNHTGEVREPIVFQVYNGDTCIMAEEMISGFEIDFPRIDVRENLQKMATWLRNKPSARPMGPAVENFARRWLARADSGF